MLITYIYIMASKVIKYRNKITKVQEEQFKEELFNTSNKQVIDKKIDCDNKNGAKNVTLKNSKIVNIDSTIEVLKANDPKYNGNTNSIRPLLINTTVFSRYAETEELLSSIKTNVKEKTVTITYNKQEITQASIKQRALNEGYTFKSINSDTLNVIDYQIKMN